jgi:hypothetical protein
MKVASNAGDQRELATLGLASFLGPVGGIRSGIFFPIGTSYHLRVGQIPVTPMLESWLKDIDPQGKQSLWDERAGRPDHGTGRLCQGVN